MANIALLAQDISGHSATDSCDAALVASGHTVTQVADIDINTHDFSAYDLVVTVRVSGDATWTPDIVSRLTTLNDGGTPLVLGLVEEGKFGESSSTGSIPTSMGLMGNVALERDIRQLEIEEGHPIVGSVIPKIHTGFYVNDANMSSVASGEPFLGQVFARGTRDIVAGLPMGMAIDAGTPKLTSGATGARIVVFPTYSISGAWTSEHVQLLENSVEWALTGTVTDVPPPEVQVHKLVSYAVLDFPLGKVGSSKLTAYAVMDLPEAKVGASKLTAYAVMDQAANIPPPPPPPPETSTEPQVGETLGYQGDTWDNGPTSFIHQWYRDDNPIPGAEGSTYTLGAADEGAMIKKSLIGVNGFGQSDPVFSDEVGPIAPGTVPTSYQLGENDSLFDTQNVQGIYQDSDKTLVLAAYNDPIGYFERSTE